MQDQRETHKGPLHGQQLLHTVGDLYCFILHKVVHIDGEFVHPEHELSTDQKYKSLRQWDNQQLRVGYSSVTQGEIGQNHAMNSMRTLMMYVL